MTPQQILKDVQDKADARFGDTIERLLLTLRQRHTHQCWRKECFCEYCLFIRGQYVDAKMALHRINKRIRNYERDFYLTDGEVSAMLFAETSALVQKQCIRELRDHKKHLQKDIL